MSESSVLLVDCAEEARVLDLSVLRCELHIDSLLIIYQVS